MRESTDESVGPVGLDPPGGADDETHRPVDAYAGVQRAEELLATGLEQEDLPAQAAVGPTRRFGPCVVRAHRITASPDARHQETRHGTCSPATTADGNA